MSRNWMMLIGFALVSCSGQAFGQTGPSEEHKILKEDVGAWDCEMKMWMGGPGSEPMVVKGTEENKMMGDLWIVSTFKADFGGQPFEGRAVLGFDPSKKKYVGHWFDSMNPHISVMEGDYNKETKTMTMMTRGVGPDGKPSKGKNVMVYKEDGSRVFSMYMAMPGQDEMVKGMEIVYTKKN